MNNSVYNPKNIIEYNENDDICINKILNENDLDWFRKKYNNNFILNILIKNRNF